MNEVGLPVIQSIVHYFWEIFHLKVDFLNLIPHLNRDRLLQAGLLALQEGDVTIQTIQSAHLCHRTMVVMDVVYIPHALCLGHHLAVQGSQSAHFFLQAAGKAIHAGVRGLLVDLYLVGGLFSLLGSSVAPVALVHALEEVDVRDEFFEVFLFLIGGFGLVILQEK